MMPVFHAYSNWRFPSIPVFFQTAEGTISPFAAQIPHIPYPFGIPTFQPAPCGRVYAAYGGFFIVLFLSLVTAEF